MNLQDRVIAPGFVHEEELAVLMQSCRALVFPSLFEGFGMPVLEAMSFDKPVLCSSVTSLPEVAGDAALFFDPRRPADIVHAVERIESEPLLREELIRRGRHRLLAFTTPAQMAGAYLDLFQQVVGGITDFSDAIYGVYGDGWTSDRVYVSYREASEPRELEITMTAPPWLPFDRLSVKMSENGEKGIDTHLLRAGGEAQIKRRLRAHGGFVEIAIAPVFQPSALGLNEDPRFLGCRCVECAIVSPSGRQRLL
jgi:hypothetical protein